jgi:lambda repressor-like predicted transcriptional regulator
MVKWSEEIKLQVKALNHEGKSLRDIATATGISKSTIHSFIKSLPSETTIVDSVQEVNVPEILSADIQEDSMINDVEANNFMNELLSTTPTISAPVTKVSKKASKSAENFMENLLTVEPKTPKPRGQRQRQIVHKEVDDPQVKGDMIARVTMNVNNFEPLLKDFLKPSKDVFLTNLQKKSCSELEVLLKSMETTRSVSNLTNQFMHFFYLGTNVVEMGTTQYLGMDTTGFSMALRQQHEEIQMIMKELCMDRVESFKKVTKPEIRLAMIMTTTLIGVNTSNQMRKMQNISQPKPSKKETAQPQNEILPTPMGQPPKPKTVTFIPEDKVETFNDL